MFANVIFMEQKKADGDAKKHSPLREPHKTFQKDGHWIEKPNKTPILLCDCGNRYLKTRRNQTKCLRCMAFAR